MSDFDLKINFDTNSDFKQVYEFLDTHFHKGDEPMQEAHFQKDVVLHPTVDLLELCLERGGTLLAYIGDVLVGVLLGVKLSEHEKPDESELPADSEKSSDVYKFLRYIDKKTDFYNRLGVSEIFNIFILSVHRDYRGHGIGRKLFEFCIENAKKLKYPAVTVDCSSLFTAKIAESYNFKLVTTTTYDEYNELIGKKLFTPIEPHIEILSYALLLD